MHGVCWHFKFHCVIALSFTVGKSHPFGLWQNCGKYTQPKLCQFKHFWVYSSVPFNTLTMLCNLHYYPLSEMFILISVSSYQYFPLFVSLVPDNHCPQCNSTILFLLSWLIFLSLPCHGMHKNSFLFKGWLTTHGMYSTCVCSFVCKRMFGVFLFFLVIVQNAVSNIWLASILLNSQLHLFLVHTHWIMKQFCKKDLTISVAVP